MALQTSGPISLSDIENEFGGSGSISLSEYYGADGGIPSSGTISMSQFYGASSGVTMRYLVVASGGAGGRGGGGAGGMLENTILVSSSASGSITVGAAVSNAPGDALNPAQAVNGNNSVLSISGSSTITAIGGGGGATATYSNNADGFANGGNGGSGGGSSTYGSSSTGTPGLGTPGQGFDGADARNSRGGYDGAGGGAGGVAVGATGGPGATSDITGSSVTYAEGGSYNTGVTPTPAGSGGGAGYYTSRDGIVIIRIPTSATLNTSGLTVSTSTVGSDRVYSITSGSGTWSIS